MNTDFQKSSSKGSLKEFRAFVGELLGDESEDQIEAIGPLTSGLGLESPIRSVPVPEIIAPKPQAPSRRRSLEEKRVQTLPPPIPKPIFNPAPEIEVIEEVPSEAPPPLPSVSLLKRASCAFLDQVFVLTLWLISLVITSNIFSGFETGLSAGVLRNLSEPLFFRFAVLEFATLWMAYLALGLGIFGMTFGMWVWGIRISYGDRRDENYGLRKLMRILWSFVFYAPILPSSLLVFRKNDKNLVDALSGSNLYLG